MSAVIFMQNSHSLDIKKKKQHNQALWLFHWLLSCRHVLSSLLNESDDIACVRAASVSAPFDCHFGSRVFVVEFYVDA